MGSPLVGLRRLAPSGEKAYERFVPSPFRAGQAVFSDWSVERAIKHGFKANVWAYRCVSMTMELGSTVPFGWQTLGSDGKWSFDWSHPLSSLLGYWNDDFSAQESLSMLIAYLLLGGNALVGKFGSPKIPSELVAESPVGVRPIPNGLGGIERYEYMDQGQRKYWDSGDVCHGRLPDPENRFWGMGRLRAIAKAVDTDIEAVNWNKRRIEVGGVPDGILVDKSILSPEQRQEAQKEIDDTWRDIAGPFVTGEGVDWIQLGLSQNDLQWLEGRKFTMREIVIGFGYNPALFGEDSTYNNSITAERQKWTGAIIPLLNVLASMFTRGLVPRPRRVKERIWYDTSGVDALREDRTANIEGLAKLVSTGTPYDTAKDFLGLALPDLPNGQGKVALINSQLVTLVSLIEADQQETPAENVLPGTGPVPEPGAEEEEPPAPADEGEGEEEEI